MHQILRHSQLPLAGAIVAALALTACAGPNSGGTTAPTGSAQTADWGKESGTIEFWDTNANPVLSKKWAELITQFEAKYPLSLIHI